LGLALRNVMPDSLLRHARISWLLLVLILGGWIAVSIALDQSVFAVQPSRKLLQFGALNGDLLSAREWWRVPLSQFLHAHAPHMLFNALAVLFVGAVLERDLGRWYLAAVYTVGGSVGQVASTIFYPDLVSSGASQALMALCGAAMIMCRTRSIACMLVIAILSVQLALDLRAVGTVKAGHGWGFAAGILMGVVLLVSRRSVGNLKVDP
jgi:rhomboid protease GluP